MLNLFKQPDNEEEPFDIITLEAEAYRKWGYAAGLSGKNVSIQDESSKEEAKVNTKSQSSQ